MRSEQTQTFTQKLVRHAKETDEVLFDGQWLSSQEAEQLYHRLERDSVQRVAELAVLFFLMFIAAMMPFAVLKGLGGIVS